MRFDEIDATKAYNDPNSCYRPDDEQLYTITEWDGTDLLHNTKDGVVDYVLFKINKAQMEDDDEEAFEVAKEYLERFDAVEEE